MHRFSIPRLLSSTNNLRHFSTHSIERLRNIWISGLIDPAKATVSEREKIVVEEVPADMDTLVLEKRRELIKTVSEVDDKLAEAFCNDRPISAADLQEAVHRATVELNFIPVFMGSAFKYKGLQLLWDGVLNYLPCPCDPESKSVTKDELEALTFTLNRKYGPITYLRYCKL
ncbi:hypothetical protein TSUD_379010 [Trifolium subterraneum]|uniref:Uncharacterized protein n=1 Tax=Trifolium subterraneum TaxID=3900 RepID=A0A2Z6NR73_TRISU|nr:hypothetical protein TSUD_379010 [Trifolium subterraneum]